MSWVKEEMGSRLSINRGGAQGQDPVIKIENKIKKQVLTSPWDWFRQESCHQLQVKLLLGVHVSSEASPVAPAKGRVAGSNLFDSMSGGQEGHKLPCDVFHILDFAQTTSSADLNTQEK